MANKVGDRVQIYEDPYTEQRKEGLAVLCAQLRQDNGFVDGRRVERWMVQFSPSEHGVPRFLLAPREDGRMGDVTMPMHEVSLLRAFMALGNCPYCDRRGIKNSFSNRNKHFGACANKLTTEEQRAQLEKLLKEIYSDRQEVGQ